MKKKIIAISMIFLAVLTVAGGSMAWLLSNPGEAVNQFEMGTVKVEVLEPNFQDLTNISAGTYTKNVKVASRGTKRTYVRVSLFPEWSEPSLPISNVQLNLNLGDWVDGGDGFYYYKYYLTENQESSLLLNSITFNTVGPEYEGETLTIKVLAEGVQITNDAWKDIWGIDPLPFTEGVAKP